MSSGLKPLLLAQLPEARAKQEPPPDHDGDLPYNASNSSSSDIASLSPITSTFSRTGCSRFSGSASSLELAAPSPFDSPASPTQLHVGKNTKSPLPDVQEDPLEREDEDPAPESECDVPDFGLYDCLCRCLPRTVDGPRRSLTAPVGDVPCSQHGDAAYPFMTANFDYDLGFLSDGDFGGNPRQKKKRHVSDTGFSSWGARLGSRLPSLHRLRSASTSRRRDLTFSPASDPSLADRPPRLSRAASSRSSSVSGPAYGAVDFAQDPAVPATPALSFYGSCESVALPSPLDAVPRTLGKSLERDRAAATTPLLPPLLTDAGARQAQPQSLHASPLQSPSMAPSPTPEQPTTKPFATPPLSTRPSVSSLRRGTVSSAFSDAPSPVPCFFDHQDRWSDRLGHANFTIEPRPYLPETVDLSALQAFRADWNLARTNFAKHLVRTGEHYGATSRTYALTEAKWAEIEREWQHNEDVLVEQLGQQWKDDPSLVSLLRRPPEEKVAPAIPRMLNDDGKFPELGDVEIVGPMVREAVMARDGQDEKRNSASVWLKNLAGKVGLRK